jgi:galactokinase
MTGRAAASTEEPDLVVDPADMAPDRLRAALAGVAPEAAAGAATAPIARAPGRVNLIGEHTDYNLGLVLPAAIELEIRIAFVPTDDRRVELALIANGERAGFSLDDVRPASGAWIDYPASVAWSLQAAGVSLHGFRGVLASTLPIASGLSSSAAIELASAWALLDPPDLAAHGLDGMRLAQLAQRAENEHVGVKSGLMDQFASSLGRAGCAMLLDCRSLDYRPVSLPLDAQALVVCDSGSPRRLGSSAYNARRAQCERAVAMIAREVPGVASLRDVDLPLLDRFRDRLDEETARRCEHVIRENGRVLAAVDALEAGDATTVARVFAESHASLRDLYEVSSAELDALVELAGAVQGTAARMTGAGFGGCTVNLVPREGLGAFRDVIETGYRERTGLEARVFEVDAAAGAGLLA